MKTTAGVLGASALFSSVVGGIYWFVSDESAGTMMLVTMAVGFTGPLAGLGFVTATLDTLRTDPRQPK